jgi:SAM-dependent methyltransferase
MRDKTTSFPEKRFPKVEGIDYKHGAIAYANKLDASDRHHLHTKPFYNLANKISRWTGDGLDEDTRRHFCDFANIAYTLALPAGARILDIGCGSGWLCEYFARLGYDITGIDISPDLIQIANERLGKVPYGVDHQTPLSYRFIVHDIESEPLSETFDAVLCYDSLHHFEDEHAVLKNIAAMLDYGAQLFVLEGEKPPESSDTEEELRRVMKEYATLESPFIREYLFQILTQYGFAIVGDYTTTGGMVDRDCLQGDTIRMFEPPAFNYLLCKKIWREDGAEPLLDSRNPQMLRARFSLRNEPLKEVSPSSTIELTFAVENVGNTLWLVSRSPLKGRVRLGVKVLDDSQKLLEEVHGYPTLQHAVAPGEKVALKLNWRAPEKIGSYTLKIDLVNQDICWFEEHGSEPLFVPFRVS